MGGLTAGMSGGTARHGQNQKMGEPAGRRIILQPSAAAEVQLERVAETGRAQPGVQGQTVEGSLPAAGFGSKIRGEAVQVRGRGIKPGRCIRGEAFEVGNPAGQEGSGL